MPRKRILLLMVSLGLAGCGGSSTGTLKGTVVNGTTPVTSEGQLVSLTFYPLMPDGTPNKENSYTAVLGTDGAFEVVASGGALPTGRYRVVVASAATQATDSGNLTRPAKKGKSDRFADCSTLEVSKLEIEVKSGENQVVIDLAKAAS